MKTSIGDEPIKSSTLLASAMKNTFDPLQIQDDLTDYDRAIEESQRRDIEWSLNGELSEEKLTVFENVLGFSLFVLLLPFAIPAYFYMKHLGIELDD